MATTTAPTSTATATKAADAQIKLSTSRLADNEQTFLALLTTQLKNQDPLSPLDSNQFTQQLVQMTGVEQQLLTNTLLKSLVGNSNSGLSSAVGLIGKTATADTNLATLDAGKASWNYAIDGSPTEVLLSVQNSQGQTVWSGSPTKIAGGAQTFTWNGVNSGGRQLPSGDTYSLTVSASDVSGGKLSTSTSQKGVVSGIETVDGATQVSIGKTRLPLSSITSVADATVAP